MGLRARAAILVLVALGIGFPAQADWTGFYAGGGAAKPRRAAPLSQPVGPPPISMCLREILRAQLRHGIPDNLLLGIGLQEAGRSHDGVLTVWPYAVNAAGEGRVFDSRDAALDWVDERQAAGVDSIDVGCMQINLRWHPEAFEDPAQGFDPAINVDYAARFLKRLYRQTGDWSLAAGSYHSFTPDKQAIYLSSLKRNLRVANERIDGFRVLAAGTGVPQTAPARTTTPAQTAARAGFWSAGSGQAGQARHSIYSDSALQPVLPYFRKGD